MVNEYTGITNLEVMREAENYNRFLVELVLSQAHPGDVIVDFGAGAGTFALPLTAAGKEVICVEPDATLFRHLASNGLNVVSDLGHIDDASVDYIYTLNVLEHIMDDAAILALWYRKLKSGGRVLVYVPAFNVLFSSMDRKVGHHRRYRLAGLRDMLRAAGFEIVRGSYVDCLGFPATLLFKLIDDGSGSINVHALRIYDRVAFPLSRALDRAVSRFGGKNLYVFARKPS